MDTQLRFLPQCLYLGIGLSLLVFVLVETEGKTDRNQFFKVVYENNVPISREEETIQCYKFSWMGPEGDDTNKTEGCARLEQAGRPCFEPLVWTTGVNKNNGPNTTIIEEKCQQGNTLTGGVCNPLCIKNEDSCVKMTYFKNDDDRTIEYFSSFCGKGFLLSDDGSLLENSCHTQKNDGGYDVEVCFCDTDRCNSAHGLYMNHLVHALSTMVALWISSRLL
ncbi:uncharacterized protein LOC131886948 [Tigriopus californicus]|uniref:uncharacterized protein LOC131886948 n=1 Tax=Tigriopus californicus TaxID=6832 RepID=UPI0027D9E3B3|nr:uncharacterized protein LOC131886948 [Tigriopus californicus]|eukprot:TCALIF_10696-PA protein Name:"Protein of unknown function" AED:0.15 eAED:0.23 QI:0/-1/0/1/-1/1/1/0/220